MPSAHRSGIIPSRACAPPAAARKPVITSSKMSRLPLFVQAPRSSRKNPGSGSMRPTFAGYGSRIAHAIFSPSFSKHSSTAAASLKGSTIVSFAKSAGMPAESGS